MENDSEINMDEGIEIAMDVDSIPRPNDDATSSDMQNLASTVKTY